MQTYFQRGLGLKAEVAPQLKQDYKSGVIQRIKDLGFKARAGSITIQLAHEFGFCYGVDRAIEYAYETRRRFPDRKRFLSGEIIHNPAVNARLIDMGFVILPDGEKPEERYASVGPEDVVVLPAFGVSVREMNHLREKGSILVDTTCGSVLNVWKNVSKYARDGFTVVIHGKHYHEETRATASQALLFPEGRYLCVKDEAETRFVCDFVHGRVTAQALLEKFSQAVSPAFDPARDLQRVGLANQTTMLMSESLRVQELLRAAFIERFGESELGARFRAFDTICSATQDRQDAVLQMFDESPPDVMLVIGGYNSSNTQALSRICAQRCPSYHIDAAENILDSGAILHRPIGASSEIETAAWLKDSAIVGVTAGASTPDTVVATAIERVLATRGLSSDALGPVARPS